MSDGFSELLKERDNIGGLIAPQSLNGSSASSPAIDMSLYNRVQFLGFIGAKTTNSSVRAYLQQTPNSNGVGGVNIAGPSQNAITTNIVNTGNTAFRIEVQAMQLTQRYVVAVVEENASLAATVGGLLIGTDARFQPVGADVNTNQAIVVA